MVFGKVSDKKIRKYFFFPLEQRIHRVIERSQQLSDLCRNGEYKYAFVPWFPFLELIHYPCFSDKNKLFRDRKKKGIHPYLIYFL